MTGSAASKNAQTINWATVAHRALYHRDCWSERVCFARSRMLGEADSTHFGRQDLASEAPKPRFGQSLRVFQTPNGAIGLL